MGTRSLKSRVLFVEVAIALFLPDDQVAAGLAPPLKYQGERRMLLHHWNRARGFAPRAQPHPRKITRSDL